MVSFDLEVSDSQLWHLLIGMDPTEIAIAPKFRRLLAIMCLAINQKSCDIAADMILMDVMCDMLSDPCSRL